MRSPFPGMDPYLEVSGAWPDFHSTFINYWREAIADALPDDYDASINERVFLIETDPDTRRLIYPDVAVSDDGSRLRPSRSGSAVATLEPTTVPLEIVGESREAYIEILHREDRSLVAVAELLSPGNKQEPGRAEYLQKRNAIIRQAVHLVELDLLLGGRRLPFGKPLPIADYYYTVARAEQRPDCQVYGWMLKDALPSMPIPLRFPDEDVMIDLAAVFKQAFERGRFFRRLPYRGEPPAALSEEQKAWVASRLAQLK